MSTPSFHPSADGAAFVETWRRVMTEPTAFFAEMPDVGPMREPFTFLVICAAIDAVGQFFVSWCIWATIGTFAGVVVGAVVMAAVLTLVAQHLFGGRAGFEPTFRAICYASAPVVFFWVPRGFVLAWLYAWYLEVRGVERVQGFDGGHAVMTVVLGVLVVWLVAAGLTGHVGP